jgi:Ni,Fe-hydrogenase I cytochrome b subunit
MYKKQVKLQRTLCLVLLLISAVLFIYSLGIMTDLYDSLYSTYRRGKTSISGAEVYMDMQGFNKSFLHASIGMILLSVLLFVTNTHNRRKYYIGNYTAIGLFSVGSIAMSVWAHGQIEAFKAQFLTIDFAELADHAAKRKTLYTESTFWFDIHYILFGLLLIGTVLLIANAIWKRKLMKEEQALIAQGKEAVA